MISMRLRRRYINLWIMYLQMAFLTGAISEHGVFRTLSGELFLSAAGLAYWKEADSVFEAEASTGRHRRFLATARTAYAAVLAHQPRTAEMMDAEPSPSAPVAAAAIANDVAPTPAGQLAGA